MIWEELYSAVSFTLFLFWIFGVVSVLVDLDHLWKLFGRDEPVNLTGWKGRPLHNPIVYLGISGVCSIVIITFIYGLAGGLFQIFRQAIWMWSLFGLSVATYLVAWRLGSKLNGVLENDDYDRNKS